MREGRRRLDCRWSPLSWRREETKSPLCCLLVVNQIFDLVSPADGEGSLGRRRQSDPDLHMILEKSVVVVGSFGIVLSILFGRIFLSLVSLVTGQSWRFVLLSASGFYLPARFWGFGLFCTLRGGRMSKAGSSSSSGVRGLGFAVSCGSSGGGPEQYK
ncbi:hypothetical protein F2Q69_00009459 [Brassica cretica]|uniref:Uncharacterized protein n=1 Tax=Brassica cretica TaxID=69181 RepID=A0A8S9PHE4_BRACR|nr:hypothetical protein F2Q69_00009459 [Brassica cretica]